MNIITYISQRLSIRRNLQALTDSGFIERALDGERAQWTHPRCKCIAQVIIPDNRRYFYGVEVIGNIYENPELLEKAA